MRNSFDSFLASTLEYKELPEKLEEEELKSLLEDLQKGEDVSERLIKGYMRLGMSIVAERATRQWADDLIGTVFLELTKRIDWIKKGKKQVDHTTITPYLVASMRHRRNDFLCTFPYSVRMENQTLRKRRNRGAEEIKLPTVISYHKEYSNFKNGYWVDDTSYLWPEDKRHYIEPEVIEILSLAIHTETERRVITFRAQGYTQKEVSEIIHKTPARVCQINRSVEERFYLLMG